MARSSPGRAGWSGATEPERADAAVARSAELALAFAEVFGLDVDALVSAAPRLLATSPRATPSADVRAAANLVTRDDAPYRVGELFARTLAAAQRRRGGVVYTPRSVAEGLVAAASDDVPPGRVAGWHVVDPACGGGAFLLAAASALVTRGVPADEVVADRLWGVDVDAGAVAVTEAALALWAALRGGHRGPGPHVATGDALLDAPASWRARFDLVAGNPPFLGQLLDDTRHRGDRRNALRARWGEVVRPYADTSALFLAAARSVAAPGGRIVLVQPTSVLGARDAAPARAAVLAEARLHGLWLAGGPVFEADVLTCAPVIAVDAAATPTAEAVMSQPKAVRASGSAGTAPVVRRWLGADVEPVEPGPLPAAGRGGSWAALAAGALGVPAVSIGSPPATPATVGDLANVTAGFRDQFYGLAPFVCEAADDPQGSPADDWAPLITSGLIDVGVLRWGERTTRFAGRRWSRPVADLRALRDRNAVLARWFEDRRRPKVLVANQTRVIEAVVDPDGRCLPSVPVVSVEPRDAIDVWRLAAALSAPPVVAWAFHQHAGAARSADALRVSARLLASVPLPVDGGAWAEATHHFEAGRLDAFSVAATVAYGLEADDPVVAWWLGRLPAGPRGR